MLDPKFIISNLEVIKSVCQKRNVNIDLDSFVDCYNSYKACLRDFEDKKMKQGILTNKIKKLGSPDNISLIEESRLLKDQISSANVLMAEKKSELDSLLLKIPNLIHPEVPLGIEGEHVVLKQYGACPLSSSDHLDICKDFDLLDFDSAGLVSGYGFCYLKNQAVILELALVRYAIDFVSKFANFTLLKTPDLARGSFLTGSGFSPRGEESQVFLIEDEDLCLIGTSEITINGFLSEKVFELKSLPKRYVGLSHCFRKEAGSHGKACRGLFRLRQFTKLEMFSITSPKESDNELDFIVSIQEEFIKSLGLSYQICSIPAGDLGAPAYKKIDIEVWMPSRSSYGEVSSASNCTSFQSRRLMIRFKENNKLDFVHTLNGTAVAVPRIILSIIENFYDGNCIKIPSVLVPYTGFDKICKSND